MKTQTCPHFWRERCLRDPCQCNPPAQAPERMEFDHCNYAISERAPGPRDPVATGVGE